MGILCNISSFQVIGNEGVVLGVNGGDNLQLDVDQLFDEMDLTPTCMQAPSYEEEQMNQSDGQPDVEVHALTPIGVILEKIRRRKSERILKKKLSTVVGGPDAPGNSNQKALNLD